MSRNLLIASLVVILIGMGAMVLWKRGEGPARGAGGSSIASVGGRSMSRFDLGATPIHRQRDPRWTNETIGGSNETLGAVGCAVCDISMALSHYGVEIPPDSLNALLKSHDGYTERGWLKWETIAAITGGRVGVDVPSTLDHRTIDDALTHGSPILAKVLVRGTIAHWVLIVGKDGNEYLIKDPLGDGKELDKLSGYNSNIYAIRVVRPAA